MLNPVLPHFKSYLLSVAILLFFFVGTIVCIRFPHIASAELTCEVNADDMQQDANKTTNQFNTCVSMRTDVLKGRRLAGSR